MIRSPFSPHLGSGDANKGENERGISNAKQSSLACPQSAPGLPPGLCYLTLVDTHRCHYTYQDHIPHITLQPKKGYSKCVFCLISCAHNQSCSPVCNVFGWSRPVKISLTCYFIYSALVKCYNNIDFVYQEVSHLSKYSLVIDVFLEFFKLPASSSVLVGLIP